MAELSTVARPYAEAAFSFAKTADLSAWSTLMEKMAFIAQNSEMRAAITNPKLSDGQIYDLFTSVYGDKLGNEASNFLRLLIENGRLILLPEIAAQFAQLKNAYQGTADAFIESAFALSDAQIADLIAVLEKKFKIKLKPQVKVDSSLIGGVRITVGDQVLDSSVREDLQRMKVTLTA